MKEKTELFSSRYAFLFAAIQMAIGAVNIWYFPRLAGQYGGAGILKPGGKQQLILVYFSGLL